MLLSIISIILCIVYCIVLNLKMFNYLVAMPNGGELTQLIESPITELCASGKPILLYLQFASITISIITSILIMCGVKSIAVKRVQLVSIIVSTVCFAVIMIVTGNPFQKIY